MLLNATTTNTVMSAARNVSSSFLCTLHRCMRLCPRRCSTCDRFVSPQSQSILLCPLITARLKHGPISKNSIKSRLNSSGFMSTEAFAMEVNHILGQSEKDSLEATRDWATERKRRFNVRSCEIVQDDVFVQLMI